MILSYIYKALNGLIILLIVSFLHCDLTESPENKTSLTLTLEDVSCTEAWLTLKSTNIQILNTIAIKQNDQIRITINLTSTDTLLYIDSLLPKQTYTYQVSGIGNPVSSNAVTVTTLDTTSHNFTWQTFTFGQHSSSVLYDVAIINENNIWAVGEIYMNDSLGNPDPHAYNAVHWDGQSWELKKIMFYTFCPQGTDSGSYPASSIFAFDDQNIVVSSGSQVAYLKNGLQIKRECVPVSVNKIWGTSISDFYIVGYGGGIAHSQNGVWTKIESVTTVNLSDIYGTPDGKEVWTCGWNNSDGHTVLMKIANNHSEMIYDSFNPNKSFPYNGFISSLWTNGRQFFWLTGTSKGVVKHSYSNTNFIKLEKFAIQYFPYRIRGTDVNNISTTGDASMIWHFNGYSWRLYDELLNLDDRVRSMDVQGGVIVAVGLRYESILAKGLLIIGKK